MSHYHSIRHHCKSNQKLPYFNQEYVIGSTLLMDEGPIKNGGILVNGDHIREVGNFDDLLSQYPNVPFIDCRNTTVLSPGFINPHEHTAYSYQVPDEILLLGYDHRNSEYRYTNRFDWILGSITKQKLPNVPGLFYYNAGKVENVENAAKIAAVEIRHLLSGTTTIAGPGGVPGIINNAGWNGTGFSNIYTEHVDYEVFPFDNAVVTRANFTKICDGGRSSIAKLVTPDNFSYVAHVGEGLPTSCIASTITKVFLDWVEYYRDTSFTIIHGVAADDTDFVQMAKYNVSLIWSPRSNLCLYGQTVDLKKIVKNNINIALGTDWSPSGSFNILQEIKCAKQEMIRQNVSFTDQDFWRFTTKNAAYSLKIQDELGEVACGKRADFFLSVYNEKKGYYGSVVDQDLSDVLGVWINGTAMVLSKELQSIWSLDAYCCNNIKLEGETSFFTSAVCFCNAPFLNASVWGLTKDYVANGTIVNWSGEYSKQGSCNPEALGHTHITFEDL